MRELVLLGAGASVEAGVPDAFDMSKCMVELLGSDYSQSIPSKVIRLAVGGVLFQKGVRGENPFEGVNVEELFNAVQLLADRETLEGQAFISSWHPLVDRLDRARPDLSRFTDQMSDAAVKAVSKATVGHLTTRGVDRWEENFQPGKRTYGSNSLGEAIGELVKSALKGLQSGSARSDRSVEQSLLNALNPKSGGGAVFKRTAHLMIRALSNLVWVTDATRVEYLKPLLRISAGDSRVFATLNYDNALELAGESCGVPVETGIEVWSDKQTFPRAADSPLLLKLHGSIDWGIQDGEYSEEKPLPSKAIRRLSADEVAKLNHFPAVIFGGKNKLTASGPYLDLLRAFKTELMDAARVTVIGYSFRDDHVNEYLQEWINADRSHQCRIINGPFFRRTPVEFAQRLIGLSGSTGRVIVFEGYAKEGIAALFAEAA